MIEGRDTRGRFATGNRCSPGRPKKAVEWRYLLTLRDVVPVEEWRTLVQDIWHKARAGDPWSIQWIADRILPKDANLADVEQELDEEADWEAALIEAGVQPKHNVRPEDVLAAFVRYVEHKTGALPGEVTARLPVWSEFLTLAVENAASRRSAANGETADPPAEARTEAGSRNGEH
jgi:hypothetical protein